MKKSLLAVAALTAFTGVAYAQSSVTLFGVVDLSARSTKTGSATIKTLSTDGNASSRLGFRGVEDLGGGLRAGFWLESGLAADSGGIGGNSGIATVHFNRRATASLMGGFGEIRLGRDYTPSFWNYTVFDAFGTNGVASATNIVDAPGGLNSLGSGAITFVRDNNTIGYFLPVMGGLYGQLMVAAGENVSGTKYQGVRLGYAAGPVNVAVAMGKTKRTHAMVDDLTDKSIGGSFNMGFATLMAQYSKRDYGVANQNTKHVSALVPLGAGNFKISYGKSDGNTDARDMKQLGVGYVYDLSKRTALYAHYAKLDRKINPDTTSYEFGVRHSF